MADGDKLGIGEKTIAESYDKIYHSGDDTGVGFQCSPLCTSSGSNTYASNLWLGKLGGSNQMALVKATEAGSEFFAIQNQGSDTSTASSILSAFDKGGTISDRGRLLLRQEFHIAAGSSIPQESTYASYNHGIIVFPGAGYNHSIYSANNKTIFDNGFIHGSQIGNFKFLGELEIGGSITLGDLASGDGKIECLELVSEDMTVSGEYILSAGASDNPIISSANDLEIAAASGMKIGVTGGMSTPTLEIETIDGTTSTIAIDATTTIANGNTAINIGAGNLGTAGSIGTQLVTIGDFDTNPANNLHGNASYVELALKSPKTKFYTGSIFAKINTYDGSGNLCFPDFAVNGVSADEAVLSFQGIDAESTHTVTSKVNNEDRNIIIYADNDKTYEVDKYDITVGRKTFYKMLAGAAGTDAPNVPDAQGDVTVYAKADRFNILGKDADSASAFYLDLDNSTSNANNRIQEAQPAALTSSDAVGSPTQGEYDALRADVVALRSTVEALMTELKTFRLWKENSGVAV